MLVMSSSMARDVVAKALRSCSYLWVNCWGKDLVRSFLDGPGIPLRVKIF